MSALQVDMSGMLIEHVHAPQESRPLLIETSDLDLLPNTWPSFASSWCRGV